MKLIFTIILLLIIALVLLMIRIHQFDQPRTIRWRIGNQIFTFRFPFKWMHVNSVDYFKNLFVFGGACILGLLILIAFLSFIFLLIGFILPIILIIGLIALILILIFVI